MSKEEIVAMAVAAIAEETGTDLRRVRVISFQVIDNKEQGEQK